MISVIHPSLPGVTEGIYNIIKALQDDSDSLLEIVKISKATQEDGTRFFSWAAVFRERGTIGQIVVLVNQWGTNFGPSAGGKGSAGYCRMMSYIEDNDLSVLEVDWDEIDIGLRSRIEASTMYECHRAWEQLIIDYIFGQIFPVLPSVRYPINEKWQRRFENMRN
jgi:hypothetical protein